MWFMKKILLRLAGLIKRCGGCKTFFALDYFDITTGLCKSCHRKQEAKIYRLCQMNSRLGLTQPIWPA